MAAKLSLMAELTGNRASSVFSPYLPSTAVDSHRPAPVVPANLNSAAAALLEAKKRPSQHCTDLEQRKIQVWRN
jgi:hypothetical protein